jgi:hypothetical protein
MKKIFILAFLLASFAGQAQISGKYEASQFVNVSGTMTETTSYDIEVSGNDYTWAITATWGATSTLTTSTVGVKVSPDQSTWIDYATPGTMTSTATVTQIKGDYLPSKYVRLQWTITAGDSLYQPKAWYEFKRK